MNTAKIFFTDLDGTLLDDRKQITPATMAALNAWTNAGHKLVLCSGRPLSSIQDVWRELSLHYSGMYLIGYNGSEIWDCDRQETVYKKTMTLEEVDYVDMLAKKFGIHCHTYTDDTIIAPAESEALSYYRRVIPMPVIVSTPLSKALSSSPCKCIAVEIHDLDRLEQLRLALLPYSAGKLNVMYSNPRYLEIFPIDAGKGESVKALCKILNIPLENTISAGDQANDISMLETAHVGIAMLNGTEDVKKAADKITCTDNNHDGLADILLQLI